MKIWARDFELGVLLFRRGMRTGRLGGSEC